MTSQSVRPSGEHTAATREGPASTGAQDTHRPRGPDRVRALRTDPLVRAVAALDPDPRRSALAVLYGTLALSCAVGLMAVSGWLISRAAQHPPVLYLEMAVVATRAFGIGRGVLRYAERLASHDVALRGVAALRERLYLRLAAADPGLVAGLRRGDLLARVGADVDTLADVVVRSLLPFAVAWTTLALSAAVVAAFLPPAGLVVAGGFLVAAVVAPWLAAVAAARAERESARTRSELSAEVLALLDGVAELTVLRAVGPRLDRLAALDRSLASTLDRAARPAAAAAFVGTLATGLGMVGALLLGVQATASGRLAPVLLAVVTLTPLAAAEAVAALPAAATGLVRSRAAAQRVLDLLDAGPDVPAVGTPSTGSPVCGSEVPGSRVAGLDHPHLMARDLSCGWPGGPAILQGFDLDLRPGRRIAVVGGSGGGKTTLLLTLAGLLRPRAGQVRLGEVQGPLVPLEDLDSALVRRTVSFVAEDAHVFTTTVRENLRVADPGADDGRLHEVLDRVGLHGWVAGLPSGLDTMLESGGASLSGGERRRLLMARSLLVGAAVLLLDEPGEHLDPATADTLVTDVLFANAAADPGSTSEAPVTSGPRPAVVLVTHRLAPLGAADEVIVLDGGRVVARGTHTALLRDHEPYRKAFAAEAGTDPV